MATRVDGTPTGGTVTIASITDRGATGADVLASAQAASYALPAVASGSVSLAIEPHALLGGFTQRTDHGQVVRLVGAFRTQAR